jgi:FKBP-type peptidyl-prolyl cis-trans isomerase SlyD
MKIGADSVVVFDYTLKDPEGTVIDQGAGEDGMAYLHGHDQLVPGLEAALEGKGVGDRVEVVVPPEQGYGPRRPDALIRVAKTELPDYASLEIGEELHSEGPDGEVETWWIAAIEDEDVVLDGDHPLAGVTLHFDVTVTKVRAASAEELEHGHAHEGPDAHDE